MNEDVGKLIGNKFGEYIDMEHSGKGMCWGQYLRIRVRLNVSKPLKRGSMLKLGGKMMWVSFKYERLPIFCYYCGILGHADKNCIRKFEEHDVGGATDLQYGV
ncbi:hypothetical protein L1049_027327 [Liquidambar formosana]|uniref:CCHC-type domain-containing protein n=1 Tax=Liquidambar formosana TaxID=63359 RepID=A0AAP0N1Y1_LIQFO